MTKRKAPPAETGINPKLAALAAKRDEAASEFNRVLDALAAAELTAWNNPEDGVAQAALKKAYKAEGAASHLDTKSTERLSIVVATNLAELKLKARCVKEWDVGNAVAESIIRDLRALSPPKPRRIRP